MFEFNENIISNLLMKKYLNKEEEINVYQSILEKNLFLLTLIQSSKLLAHLISGIFIWMT